MTQPNKTDCERHNKLKGSSSPTLMYIAIKNVCDIGLVYGILRKPRTLFCMHAMFKP